MSGAAEPLRVTMFTPHLRPSSGGVYTICQFARHLASHATVNLGVREGEPVPLEGVNVFSCPSLAANALPDADVLIVGAQAPDAERATTMPARVGRQVLLLQGYGEPGNAVVTANLELFDVALAGARWLVDEAERHGCRALHVTYGLERELFFRGPPVGERAPVVSMMTHVLDWKGTRDGLDALALVRAELPDVSIRLFGIPRSVELHGLDGPDAPGTFLPELSGNRPAIGRLLRESAVFVCSSWEEGFGLPGLEALACGAALATTDTKGSRDYAHAGETALVTAPRSPDLLAHSVISLLRDGELRNSLAARGADYVEREYPDWPEAGRRLHEQLRTLTG